MSSGTAHGHHLRTGKQKRVAGESSCERIMMAITIDVIGFGHDIHGVGCEKRRRRRRRQGLVQFDQ